MDGAVWTTCSDSEEDALQEADDFMGAACAVNISKGDATIDIKPPVIKRRRIIEAEKQEPVKQEDPGKSAKALQVVSSNAKNFVSQILNPGGSEVQKKRKKQNLVEDGQGQASKLAKESEGYKLPCASGGSLTNISKTHGKQSSPTAESVKNNKAVKVKWVPNHCAECNISFKIPAYLDQHRLKAHSSKYSFRCPECNKIFSSPGATIQHRVATHNAENIFQCVICNAVLISPSSLNQHHRIYHGFSIKCSTCNKAFSSFSLLRQHQFEAHNSGMLLRCAVCSITFGNYNEFMDHRNNHAFECTVCNSTFNKLAKLRRHELTHMYENTL